MAGRHTSNSRMCHWCSYHILTSSVIYYWTDARQCGICLFYTIKKHTTSVFYFKMAFAHFGKHEKKPFDVIRCLYKMEQSHWLLCITRNCDWSRKITPLSKLIQMASREMKTYSESRIELRNLQMLKKVLGKSTQFLSSEQPCGPKSLNVSLNIAGAERIRSENMQLRSTLDVIWFEVRMKGGLPTVEICVICG